MKVHHLLHPGNRNWCFIYSRCTFKIKPDIFVVYADRFEGFAAVIASTQMNIPTAHIEGGDITEGGAWMIR